MFHALIVTASGSDRLSELLKNTGITRFGYAASGGEARRAVCVCEYDIVLINAPLADENGLELAVWLSEKGHLGVMVLVRSESVEFVQDKIGEYGIGVLGKPIHIFELQQFVKYVLAGRKRYLVMQKEMDKLRMRLDDIKYIERAKVMLSLYEGLSEEEAHKLIEKQAMNTRLSKREIAQAIIKKYGN
ncbi:MAG: ANTAR domain-containing protein [Clostridia bacterium]|nr:ANTAR domain-containing protein [Clostridia bacterium]